MKLGAYRLPLNWRDWRFGVILRDLGYSSRYGRELWIAFGPLVFEIWWRRWS